MFISKDLIVEMYPSGRNFQKMRWTWNTVNQWRKQGSAGTVPRTLSSSKTNERTRKKKEETYGTVKEAAGIFGVNPCVWRDLAYSPCLGLRTGWLDGKKEFAKRCSKMCSSLIKTFWAKSELCSTRKQNSLSAKVHHAQSEAWWWRHRAMELL